jgi:hypothetical protein
VGAVPEEPWIQLYVQPEREAPRLVPSPPARRWYWPNAYHCTPLVAAGQLGWSLLSPFEFSVVWDGQPGGKALRFTKRVHGDHRLKLRSVFGGGVLSLVLPFNLRTSPEVDILVKAPPNAPKEGVCVLEGLIETDWFDGHFSANLRFTRPGEVIRWEEGEPLCQFLPYPRGWLERFRTETISEGPEHERFYAEAGPWSEDRRALLEARAGGDKPGYDRQYRRGRRHDGGPVPSTHRTRLSVPPFPGIEPGPREL